MTGFLLDTNVVSEMTRSRPSPLVVAFLARTSELWLASLVVHELEFGLRLMPSGRRRERLRMDLSRFLRSYADRILPINETGAVWAARLRANAVISGRPPDLIDMLIAGTAKAHGLTVATRNVRDFEGLGVEVVNPCNPKTTITEADVEQVALVWLSGLGLQVAHGADIGPDAPGVEQTGGVGTNKLSDGPMDRNGPRVR